MTNDTSLSLAAYLASKELWRNRGRFILVSLVVALITVLVLFTAGLGEGLGTGNREYIQNLNAELLVYQENTDLSIGASRVGWAKLREIRRVPGVDAVGGIGFANVSIMLGRGAENVDVALIGVEPGKPGEPPVRSGRVLLGKDANEVIIDRRTALLTGFDVGQTITIRVVQGTQEEFYKLRVVGLSDSRQYGLQPSIFVPYLTWDKVRPKALTTGDPADVVFNVAAVRLENPVDWRAMAERIQTQVRDVQVVDRKTAYEAAPGYSAQQNTLSTQGAFTLFIGVLVVGGFFQIQALQKVPQIGVLKAIGASNHVIGAAAVLQIVTVSVLGVAIGGLGTALLSLGFPPTVPIVFNGQTSLVAAAALLVIGPAGGVVSVRYSFMIEPLRALGLAS